MNIYSVIYQSLGDDPEIKARLCSGASKLQAWKFRYVTFVKPKSINYSPCPFLDNQSFQYMLNILSIIPELKG